MPATSTDYIHNQQNATSYLDPSHQHRALLQTEHSPLPDDLDLDNWGPTLFSPQQLDSALQEFVLSSPMQPDATGAVPQFPPNLGRGSHQRESSLSSLGSVGPASPFAQNISNPRIAINDSAAETFHDMYNNDANIHNAGAYYPLAKPVEGVAGYQHLDAATPDMAYPAALPAHMNRRRSDRSVVQPLEFNQLVNRSHPASVASSVAGDSPSTPSFGDVDHHYMDRHRRAAYGNVPKLDRTLTDAYGDELYNPQFAITSSSPAHSQGASTTGNHIFSQCLSAANNQHLTAAHSPSPTASRGLSPFQATSPYAPPFTDFGNSFGIAQAVGHTNQSQQQAVAMGAHMTGNVEPETPKTISPKDAMLEFTGVAGEQDFPPFAEAAQGFDFNTFGKAVAPETGSNHSPLFSSQATPRSQQQYDQMGFKGRIPQQYPFISRAQEIKDITPPPRLGSSGSSASEARAEEGGNRPSRVGADSGTYSCTYLRCPLRFDTPYLLQKHKKDVHRQHGQDLSDLRGQIASSVTNSQAGPHRCDRINPSTGKPCLREFSRPYDLTRHELAIHDDQKDKVQCHLCAGEKTFSRADALNRHYRVCHPKAELPGKHRKRAV